MFEFNQINLIILLKFKNQNDVTVFITNYQTLNLCFLKNSTCVDYFQAPEPISIKKSETKPSITNEPQLIEKSRKKFNSYEDNYMNFYDFYDYEDYLQANNEYEEQTNQNKSSIDYFKL